MSNFDYKTLVYFKIKPKEYQWDSCPQKSIKEKSSI